MEPTNTNDRVEKLIRQAEKALLELKLYREGKIIYKTK